MPGNPRLVDDDFVALVHRLARWCAGLRITGDGVRTVNTPDGLTAHVSAPAPRPDRRDTGGLSLLWGQLVSAWAGGSNTVTLTPWNGPVSADGATGASNVSGVYVQFPLGSNAVALGAAAGDILPYVSITANGNSYNVLYCPPLLPRATSQYQVIVNAAATGTRWIADWVKGHS